MFEEQQSNVIREYRQVVDFSVLSPVFGKRDIERAANVAYKNKYRSLCVLPCLVEHAKNYCTEKFSDALKIGAVVGFPLGANLLSTKIDEAKRAFSQGADFVDCVIDLVNVKDGDFSAVKKEISRLVRAARRHEINIVIETSALQRDELERLCKICSKCKVDHVMTSTGFGTSGATPEVVEVMKRSLGSKTKIKAAGGVSSREDVWNLLRAGASRIATSREV